jgi:predicted GIY-YIG superfamily endonuclease
MSQELLFPDPKPLVRRLGKAFFRNLPPRAGVYKMRDAQDNIVYVGKAKNLRQRLRSYRIASPERMPRRHLRMLRDVVRIDFELCANETTALKQEAKLIRELKPRFNRAGVWPGKTRFLTWRFEQQSVEFSIQETPSAQWGRLGPLGGRATRLRAAVVRLLWLSLNPAAGFAGLPHGWARGELAERIKLECGPAAAGVRTALEKLLSFEPAAFALWLLTVLPPPLSAYDQMARQADWETIQEFVTYQNARKGDPGKLPLL